MKNNVSRAPRWQRVGFLIGAVLLLAAAAAVWRQREIVNDALASVRHPDVMQLALLLSAILANLMLSALMLSLLMSRYGRVGVFEMQALVAASALLNYLPLRAGMFGRIAWHKTVNHIPATDSARTIMQAIVISAGCAVYIAVVAAIAHAMPKALWPGAALPVPILLLAALHRNLRIWALAILFRYLDLGLWALRYHVAFALIGAPIEPSGALAFACISMMANLVPFVSNGLGLREWAIGLTAPLLTAHHLELGITAELVNRAAEIIVIGFAGAICMFLLARRWKRLPARRDSTESA